MTHPVPRMMQAWCRAFVRRRVDLSVEGLEHLPHRGPVLIVSRHYHHFYDGCIFLAVLRRPVHLLVALDWAPNRVVRSVMEHLCAAAEWPVVLRQERLARVPAAGSGASRAYLPGEHPSYLRRAVRQAVAYLRGGHVLVIFPEGYPTVDPVYTPKSDDDALLPFRAGFIRLAEQAQRGSGSVVPIVPAGFSYRRDTRWHIALRFGPAVTLESYQDRAALTRHLEEQVRALSVPYRVTTPP